MYAAILYSALSSDSYAVREQSQERLVAVMDCTGEGRVVTWAASASCPEVARRAADAIRKHRDNRARAYVPHGIPVWPCIDMLPARVIPALDIRDRGAGWRWRQTEWELNRDEPWGSAGPVWLRYRRATELMVRDGIRRGDLTPAAADHLLSRMWAAELDCGSDCQKRDVLESWTTWTTGYPPVESP
jgi:hypothetical protein